jgi:hypothetical protein
LIVKVKEHEMIETEIQGVPCLAGVGYYAPGQKASYWQEFWPEEIEVIIYSMDGARDDELAAEMTDEEYRTIVRLLKSS